jgi:hypothetical protein
MTRTHDQLEHRVIRLYARRTRRATQLGGALLGVFLGGAPAGIGALIAQKNAGPVAALIVGLLLLVPSMWGTAKVLSMLLPEVRIGVDGIALKGGFSSATRFVPFERIEHVEATSFERQGVRLWAVKVTHDGKSDALGELPSRAEAENAAEDILAAKQRWSRARSPVAGLASLESTGARIGDWLASVRALAAADDDYRKATLGRDQLLELLEDGAARAEHRVGAAMLLAAREGVEARQRIRIAADATANPKLRVALTSIAEDAVEEDAIESAIAEERARS